MRRGWALAEFDGWTGRVIRRLRRRHNAACMNILAYHSVSDDRCVFTEGAGPLHGVAEFERQIEYVAEHFRVVPLRELIDAVEEGRVLERAVALTFDDGYADTLRRVAPMLYRRRLAITVFPVTAVIGNRDLLWQHKLAWLLAHGHESKVAAALAAHGYGPRNLHESIEEHARRCYRTDLPDLVEDVLRSVGHTGAGLAGRMRPYVEPEEIALADPEFVEFGNHTHTHPVLSALGVDDQRRELSTARDVLASLTGYAPAALAIPFGLKRHYTETTVALARETGHRAALDLRRRLNRGGACGPFELSRKPAPSGDLQAFQQVVEDWPVNAAPLHPYQRSRFRDENEPRASARAAPPRTPRAGVDGGPFGMDPVEHQVLRGSTESGWKLGADAAPPVDSTDAAGGP